ncbi:hypothetical protein ACLOJK_029347 [Asimina triloba]
MAQACYLLRRIGQSRVLSHHTLPEEDLTCLEREGEEKGNGACATGGRFSRENHLCVLSHSSFNFFFGRDDRKERDHHSRGFGVPSFALPYSEVLGGDTQEPLLGLRLFERMNVQGEELLNIFGAAPIQILPNSWRIIQSVPWFCESRKCMADQHFWASLLSRKMMLGSVSFTRKWNTKIVSNLPNSVPEWKLQFFYARFKEGEDNELPVVRSVALEELERGQSHIALSGIRRRGPFRWCEGLLLSEALGVLLRGVLAGASGPSLGTRPSSEGSRALASRPTNYRDRFVERPKKRIHLVDGHQPVAVNKGAEEDVERLDEENLQLRLALCRQEARFSGLAIASLEVPLIPIPKLVSSPVLGDAGGSPPSPNPSFGWEILEVLGREGARVDASGAVLGDVDGSSLGPNPTFGLGFLNR